MSWCEEELSSFDVGDARLKNRCVNILGQLSDNPSESIPQQSHSWSETVSGYRFFQNEKVTPEEILSPHKESTISRIKEFKEVLFIQDTSEFDYSSKQNKIEGLGLLSYKYQKGFYLHPTLAVTNDRVCLGVVNTSFVVREVLKGKGKGRESDIYELFSEHHLCDLPNKPEVLVRCQHDRIIDPKTHRAGNPHKITDALKAAKHLGVVEFSINKRSS